jgi:hypothetical protein
MLVQLANAWRSWGLALMEGGCPAAHCSCIWQLALWTSTREVWTSHPIACSTDRQYEKDSKRMLVTNKLLVSTASVAEHPKDLCNLASNHTSFLICNFASCKCALWQCKPTYTLAGQLK